VLSFVAAQLGSADARCDRDAVLGRRDLVVVAVADQGRAGDRVEAVPYVMACARLELGRVGGCGGWVPLVLASGGQAPGQRAIGWMCLQPALVPAAVSQLELRRRPLLGRELLQLLQRIGNRTGADVSSPGSETRRRVPQAGHPGLGVVALGNDSSDRVDSQSERTAILVSGGGVHS